MSAIIDQAYLLTDQYKDAAKFDARIRLHRLFSTNKFGWQRWCFDHYALPAAARVLELGCGPAHLWTLNLDRLPPGWCITLTDFSAGMLERAQRNPGFEPPTLTTLHSAHAVSQPTARRRAGRCTCQREPCKPKRLLIKNGLLDV
jgi:hypothetical protein